MPFRHAGTLARPTLCPCWRGLPVSGRCLTSYSTQAFASAQTTTLQPPWTVLNSRVRDIPPSPTLAINQESLQLKAAGKTVYRLGLGQSPFPVPKPVVAALKEHAAEKDYLDVKGLRELREAIAQHENQLHGLNKRADDVLIGPGSKELLFLLQFCYYGELLLPAPSWVSYAPQASIIGRTIKWLPTTFEEKWHLKPETVDRICRDDPSRPRILMMNYPSNPTGARLAVDELAELAEVAKKYRLLVLSDEIYGGVDFSEEGQKSISAFYPEGTIISGGLSKWAGAGGWRLGSYTFPEHMHWMLDAMANVASETYSCVSAPIQYAAVQAYKGGPEIENYLNRSRQVLKLVGNYLTEALQRCGVLVHPPEGGFYVYADFHQCHAIPSLAERCQQETGSPLTANWVARDILRQTGVALLPGSAFGSDPKDMHFRLAYVDFDGEKALEGIAEDITMWNTEQKMKFMQNFAPNIVAACDQLQSYLTQ